MRILVHDFAGHPFQIQLSRELARRGHEVLHAYCASLRTTPQASLTRRRDDPATLSIQPVSISGTIDKGRLLKRWKQERAYGRRLVVTIRGFNPDVVLSANTPLDAQHPLVRECKRNDIRVVYWLQDLIGVATKRILRVRFGLFGRAVGEYYKRLEWRLLRDSDAVVVITDDFRPILASWGINKDVVTIENWAPLDDIPVKPKDNTWSRQHHLSDTFCFLYAGTLGMKHNPALLLKLAQAFQHEPRVRVVVVSNGAGADWLAERKKTEKLNNLILMGFQPFDQMPNVLATADVLVAILELDAGVFSVPSKVLTSLAAKRPLLTAIPAANLAARIVDQTGAGMVTSPSDAQGFISEARRLAEDPALRAEMAARARSYAEENFDISVVADRFMEVLHVRSNEPRSSRR